MKELNLPGDKSLTHRYLLFAALASGTSVLENFPESDDCLRTLSILERLKIHYRSLGQQTIEIDGNPKFIHKTYPPFSFDCGNSGTTMRLFCAILASLQGQWTLTGDQSLLARPMDRIVDPLIALGHHIVLANAPHPPVHIEGKKTAIEKLHYSLPMASAQLKTALLFYALINEIPASLGGHIESRDHTEVFLKSQDFAIQRNEKQLNLNDTYKNLKAFKVKTPSDPSSAAFFIGVRLLTPGEKFKINHLLHNPTRSFYIDLLIAMGASLELKNKRNVLGETVVDLEVHYSENLNHQFHIQTHQIASLIDELPFLIVLFALTPGESIIEGVNELKHKESNRLESTRELLSCFGLEESLHISHDSVRVTNSSRRNSLQLKKHFTSKDHRMLMLRTLLEKIAKVPSQFREEEISSLNTSLPNFTHYLKI
ncbi:MAG: 3-phosphoshikimate 1-carboxyvinyltransferase [Halobacteriovoraceae bacterium]|nr:3-phosphoshikimate 1-carboxyvinyltransferase [Halobacteriovoraceae bacterium]MCB9093612.1 3-phosphoshikimate 1-carboxyvinyltransferase [Halobacteriovoraceae bacterium]